MYNNIGNILKNLGITGDKCTTVDYSEMERSSDIWQYIMEQSKRTRKYIEDSIKV